ncbi:MAG: prolipoprotein diacylglyceryl transferase family protein [Terracidiphilus sp.]|jgi:phosphatidylglycerol:prolipoprotein diacylglycerol transferase
MIPYLHIGSFSLPTFGLMLWVAAVTAAIVADRAFKRAKIDADAVGMVAVALVVGIIGSKVWHVLDTPSEFQAIGWRVLWDNAGFAWYGGLTCGIAALMWMGWRAKIGAQRTLDLLAPAAAIGYGVGRIGCFLSGDGCYGIAIHPFHVLGFTFRAWGMAFPNGIEPVNYPVYPTPLYELGAGLLIGWYLWWRLGRPHATGVITGQYLALYGIARFLVEFIRLNPKVLWGLSNAQLASAGAVLAGVALTWWAVTRPAIAPKKAAAPVQKTA